MTQRRRLLMTADRVGGVWQYATDLAQALAPLGWDTTIAVLGPVPETLSSPFRGSAAPSLSQGEREEVHAPTSLSQREREGARSPRASGKGEDRAGHPIRIIHTNLPLDWLSTTPAPIRAAAETLAALARETNADLVHLNHPALANARYPAPVLVADHGGLAPWWEAANGTPMLADLTWQVELARAGLHAADAVIAPTHAYAEAIARLYDLAGVEPVHNGRARLGQEPAAAGQQCSREGERPVRTPAPAGVHTSAHHAFTAGRLWDQVKNTPVLDRAAARLSVPFRAAGSLTGPHGQTQPIAHLRHLGQLSSEALAAEYAARPVFVSAARFEPFGLAVLEAAQAGCPLVLADLATFRELWDGAALFVPVDDAPAYAEAIKRILADPALRADLEGRAQARAACYTVEAMATATAAVYERLLSSARTPARAEPVEAQVHTPPHRVAA